MNAGISLRESHRLTRRSRSIRFLSTTIPITEEGKLVALAVTTTERSFKAPNIPNMRESAPELANFDVAWFGMFLQSGVPRPALEPYNGEIKKMLEREDIKRNTAAMGAVPDYGTPERLTTFINGEIRKFAGIINKEGLKMDVSGRLAGKPSRQNKTATEQVAVFTRDGRDQTDISPCSTNL